MNRLVLFQVAGSFLTMDIAWAAISVDIVDYPPRVQMYGPMLVTARVLNHGPNPELIPTNGLIKIGVSPDNLSWYDPIIACGGGSVVWLEPKAAWLFQVDLGRFWTHVPGLLYVAAAIQSNGECLHRATGSETFPLKLVHKTPTRQWYECWAGQETSDVVEIDITEPESDIDLAARDYIRSPEYPFAGYVEKLGLQFGTRGLRERFPTSHYTYAAAYYACDAAPDCIREQMELQPSHPLALYMRQQLALA